MLFEDFKYLQIIRPWKYCYDMLYSLTSDHLIIGLATITT